MAWSTFPLANNKIQIAKPFKHDIPKIVVVKRYNQAWGNYMTNVTDYDYDCLPILQQWLRLLKIWKQSITIS